MDSLHEGEQGNSTVVANSPPPISQSTDGSPAVPSQPLSKNAQKRLAKAARLAEQKKERRAAEKERKKEKRRLQAQKRAAGEVDDEDGGPDSRKRRKLDEQKGPRASFGARVVVDLGFDDMMTENEIKSLTSQLAFTYSANRKAVTPFASLLFTSLNGRTFDRLEGISNAAYKRWIDSEWWQEGYERLWEGIPQQDENKEDVAGVHEDGTCEDEEKPPGGRRRKSKKPQNAERESVVYLTADADEELSELRENETYIIGGICDHNRYKNLCLNRSKASGIRAARLPIGTYLASLKTRKVLTVNQTFEILLKWVETRDWEQALWTVIPRRKFQEGRRRGKGGQGVEQEGTSQTDERAVVDAEALEGDEEHEGSNDLGQAETSVESGIEATGVDVLQEKTWTTMDPDDEGEVPDKQLMHS